MIQAKSTSSVRAEYLYAVALQACIGCWPLFEMQRMRAATSARKAPGLGYAGASPESSDRWCNLFTHERVLLTAGKSRVVMPNNDTLYSNAWLDLSAGPLVLQLPDTGNRYYVLGLLDYYTNPFGHVGTRTTGNGAGAVLLSGPDWHGHVPDTFHQVGRQLRSATNWVWTIGRILVDGAADVVAVNSLQDRFGIQTLEDWQTGRDGAPRRFDSRFPAKAPLDAQRFAALVNDALCLCPPSAAQATAFAQFEALGIAARFADRPLDGEGLQALERALPVVCALLDGPAAEVLLHDQAAHAANQGTGAWTLPVRIGESFGDAWLTRAFVARQSIGALATVEAAYPRCDSDADGARLSGAQRYTLRFAPGQLPPVDAFWSITLYRSSDYFLVPNAIDRYAIGDRTPGLVFDADGGLTLTIAEAVPLDAYARANWLPAPPDEFFLCLRAYRPRPELVDGRYRLPDPKRIAQ